MNRLKPDVLIAGSTYNTGVFLHVDQEAANMPVPCSPRAMKVSRHDALARPTVTLNGWRPTLRTSNGAAYLPGPRNVKAFAGVLFWRSHARFSEVVKGMRGNFHAMSHHIQAALHLCTAIMDVQSSPGHEDFPITEMDRQLDDGPQGGK